MKTRFRVTLAAETPTAWRGELSLSKGRLENHRPLSIDPHAVVASREVDGRIVLDHRVERTGDAFDVTAFGPPDATLRCRLVDDDRRVIGRASIPVAAAREEPLKAELGDTTRWVQLNRPDRDRLRIETDRESLVFAPREDFTFGVLADPPGVERGEPFDLQVTLCRGRYGAEVWRGEPLRVESREGPFEPQSVSVPLPAGEGVYRVKLSAARPPGFRARFLPNSTAAPLVTRTFQIAVLDPSERPPAPGDWREVYAFDPGHQRWADRLPDWMRWRRLPWFATGPLSSQGRPANVEIAPTSDGAAHWRAYPLPIDEPGALYAVEVDPLGPSGEALTIGLLEPGASGELRPLGQALTDYGSRWNAAATREPLRLTVRPQTNSPLLVIANPSAQHATRFGAIRLLKSSGTPTPEPVADQRLVAIDWSDADLPRAVGASLALGGDSRAEVADLQSHWETAQTLADRVEMAGANAAVLPVNQRGAAIYESRQWRSPRFDRGVWYDATGDLPRNELLRLVFAEFRRRGLSVVPAVRFDAPAASLIDGADPASADASRRRVAVLRDVLAAVDGNEAVTGYAVRLSERDWALLDPDPSTRPPSQDGDPTGDDGDLTKTRGAALAAAYNDLGKVAASGDRRGRPLMVLPAELIERPAVSGAFAAPVATAPTDARNPILSLGLGFPAEVAKHFAVASPRQSASPLAPSPQAARSTAIERLGMSLPTRDAPEVLSVRAWRATIQLNASAELLKREGPAGSANIAFETVVADAASDRAVLAEASAEGAAVVIDQGPASAGALDEETAARRRQLAAVTVAPGPDGSRVGSDDVAAVAYDTADDRSVAVVVNRSAWPRLVRATIETPQRTLGTLLDEQRGRGEWFESGGHAVELELSPYESAVWSFRSAGVRITGVRVQPNNDARGELAAAVAELRSRDTTKRRPVPLISNASFDESAADGNPSLAAWESSLGVTRTVEAPHAGEAAARMETVDGEPVTLASAPFDATATGQLVLGLWVRGGELPDGAELKIDIESLDGAYRNGTRLTAGQLFESADTDESDEWREVVFPIGDLPLASDSPLRLRLTLAGGGAVDVDSLWVEDLLLPLDGYGAIDLRSEKLALVGLFSAADSTLEEGRLESCRELLDSYWARFLVENFPQRVEDTQDVAQQDAEAEQEADEDDPKAESTPSVTERLRGYLWRSWW